MRFSAQIPLSSLQRSHIAPSWICGPFVEGRRKGEGRRRVKREREGLYRDELMLRLPSQNHRTPTARGTALILSSIHHFVSLGLSIE